MVKKLTMKNPLRRKSRQGSASNLGEGTATNNSSAVSSISSSINANETSTDGGGSQSSTHHHTNNHNNTNSSNNIVDSVRAVGSSMRSSGTSLSGTKLKIGSSFSSSEQQQQPPDEFSPAATSSHVKTIQVPTKLGPPPHQLLTKTSTATDTTDSSGRDRSDTQLISNTTTNNNNNNNEGPDIDKAYELIPQLQTIDLPRGGVSIETTAVGHVQFGIPPETIKDSMKLGISVPSVYIVPVDRFCRDLGPALGVNLAEFEFPAYFNFFVQRKRCTLIVDSVDAERNIRRVFSETLLGPAQFRTGENVLRYEEEGTFFFSFVPCIYIFYRGRGYIYMSEQGGRDIH